jgi:hypothetical protein
MGGPMRHGLPPSMAVIAVLIVVSVISAPVAGRAQTAAAKKWTVSRTPWGDPDLGGVWTNTTSTPFERPSEFGEREFLTEEEFAKAREQAKKQERDAIVGKNAPAASGPEHWYEHKGKISNRTSHVVDPPDGKVPPLTAEAQKRRPVGTVNRKEFDSWEDLSPWDRCITRGVPGSMLPTLYNNNYQILQIPGYVVILYEMIHDARIIPVDGRPHVPTAIRQWMGDSRGHWEGDTLVVEVTNFTNKTIIHPTRTIASSVRHSEDLHVVERFTRVDANVMNYQFTVDDPYTFTHSWAGTIPMTTDGAPDHIFEYACHEGNRAMSNSLSGSRSHDKVIGGTDQERR